MICQPKICCFVSPRDVHMWSFWRPQDVFLLAVSWVAGTDRQTLCRICGQQQLVKEAFHGQLRDEATNCQSFLLSRSVLGCQLWTCTEATVEQFYQSANVVYHAVWRWFFVDAGFPLQPVEWAHPSLLDQREKKLFLDLLFLQILSARLLYRLLFLERVEQLALLSTRLQDLNCKNIVC